jgi:hypothetical protein
MKKPTVAQLVKMSHALRNPQILFNILVGKSEARKPFEYLGVERIILKKYST